jgi:hypothetical protein
MAIPPESATNPLAVDRLSMIGPDELALHSITDGAEACCASIF